MQLSYLEIINATESILLMNTVQEFPHYAHEGSIKVSKSVYTVALACIKAKLLTLNSLLHTEDISYKNSYH